MSDSKHEKLAPKKRNILYSALLETLDLIERSRETLSNWQKKREEKRERTNDYCALVDCMWDSYLPLEFKQQRVDEYNKKYGTNHTVESLS